MSKTSTARIVRTVRSTILKYRMFGEGAHVLAACSGGPDSMALVAILRELGESMGFRLSAAYFNHRLRPGAADDEALVREMCRRWGLRFVSGEEDVGSYAAGKRLNLEEAARTLRYEFLRKAAEDAGAGYVATGHTMNDQAETVLMRLMRGTGLAGLGGIAPASGEGPPVIVRPLIDVRRGDVEAYLAERRIPFRNDETNRDRRYLRNRVRLDLLPTMERDYELRIVEHLAGLAGLAREDEALLAGFIAEFADEFILRIGAKTSLDAGRLALLPPALARRVTRTYVEAVKGDLRTVTLDDVDSLLELGPGKEKTIKKGLRFVREKNLIFQKPPERRAVQIRVRWDGTDVLEFGTGKGRIVFRGRKIESGLDRLKPGLGREAGTVPGWLEELLEVGDDRTRAFFDRDKLRFPLVVRTRRPGDVYRPLGAPGRKKLKEILRAKGISISQRDALPVFVSGEDIIWVPGLPVAERYKIDASTKSVFAVERVADRSTLVNAGT
jgi:tRNA(Ile)-lysidine synthase